MTREEERFQKANELYYTHAPFEATIEMAKWADKTMLAKACKWLKDNKNHPFIGCEDPCLSGYLTDNFIEEFRKAMEE